MSPLPYVVFHAIFLLRLVSPLQWIKFVVRRRMAARPTTNLRPDFPSAFTEWYFIAQAAVALAVFLLQRVLPPLPPALHVVGLGIVGVLIAEQVVWITYYLLMRGFLESSYTIFHPAEYLLTFPLVVGTQMLWVAVVTGRDLTMLLADMIGQPPIDDTVGVIIAAVTLFYLGVAITVVLSSHPGIRTRPPQNFVVVGAGDVTRKRILPALLSLGYVREDIVVVAIDDTTTRRKGGMERQAARLEITTPARVLDTSLRERAPTILASPTHAHFAQVVRMAGSGVRFAVEKPIAASRAERGILRASPELMDNGFALSYYTLEKSLPLTFLTHPLPIYARFLTSSPASFLEAGELASLGDELGRLVAISVDLLEGMDRSPHGTDRLWTELPGTLRPLIETAIHPLMIMQRLVGDVTIRWERCRLGRYQVRADEVRAVVGEEIAPTWLEVEGSTGSTRVEVRVGKYVPTDLTSRRAAVTYTNGSVVCDFDTRCATISVDGRERGRIAINSDRYAQNYAVLMSMFIEFALNGWGGPRFDDFSRQLDALDWWDDLCDAVEGAEVPVHSYETGPPGGPLVTLGAGAGP